MKQRTLLLVAWAISGVLMGATVYPMVHGGRPAAYLLFALAVALFLILAAVTTPEQRTPPCKKERRKVPRVRSCRR